MYLLIPERGGKSDLYLSLLRLNPGSKEVQKDVRDVSAMHSRVMQAFPNVLDPTSKARAHFGILYRLEYSKSHGWVLYVQSKLPPDWDSLPPGYILTVDNQPVCTVKSVAVTYKRLRSGQLLRFRLRANVTKKVDTKSGPNGERRNGRRVPLHREEEQIAWLARVAKRFGFVPQQVIISATGVEERVRSHQGNMTFQGVLFEGVLQVSDPTLFRAALESGIGPGKAYGFGLLSIAPF